MLDHYAKDIEILGCRLGPSVAEALGDDLCLRTSAAPARDMLVSEQRRGFSSKAAKSGRPLLVRDARIGDMIVDIQVTAGNGAVIAMTGMVT